LLADLGTGRWAERARVRAADVTPVLLIGLTPVLAGRLALLFAALAAPVPACISPAFSTCRTQ
jgi:hypothetical protein